MNCEENASERKETETVANSLSVLKHILIKRHKIRY
jgi:hypothetical protein